MISPQKRIDYAFGYLALNLPKLAREELAHLSPADLISYEAQAALLELAMFESDWPQVISLANPLTTHNPAHERSWTAWAFALRELQRISEARAILLRGARFIKNPSPLVDYNLACYDCLLGDLTSARKRLARAIKADPHWENDARTDPDLAALYPRKT